MKYKKKNFKSEHKALEYAQKQQEAWKKLIVGDDPRNEKCGEDWEVWNLLNLSWGHWQDMSNEAKYKACLDKMDHAKELGLDANWNFWANEAVKYRP